MRQHTLLSLVAAGVIGAAALTAQAVPALGTENFESYGPAYPVALPDSSLLDVRNNGMINVVVDTTDANNHHAQWNAGADTHLIVIGSVDPTNYDFDLKFRIRTTSDQFNQALQIGWVDGSAALHQTQIGHSNTGVGINNAGVAGLAGFTVSNVATMDDWEWIRVVKTGDQLSVKGWANADPEPATWNTTGTMTNVANFNNSGEGGLRFKYQAGMKVDDVTSAGVPEPATLGLLSLGAMGLLARRRRA